MTKWRHELPERRLYNPRYTTWETISSHVMVDDSAAPPVSTGYRATSATSTTAFRVKVFDNGSTDIVYFDWILPSELYIPDGIKVYIGWIPDTGWSSGDYYVALDTWFATRDGTATTSGAVETQLNDTWTPPDGTTINETLLGTISPASTDEYANFRFLVYEPSTDADADFALGWIRFEYTAWEDGREKHPSERIS